MKIEREIDSRTQEKEIFIENGNCFVDCYHNGKQILISTTSYNPIYLNPQEFNDLLNAMLKMKKEMYLNK